MFFFFFFSHNVDEKLEKMHLKSYESFILADKQTDLFFKVS